MNKRLGTVIAALVLSAAAEVHGAVVPTKQPGPSPKPAPCPWWQRCTPKPAPIPCGLNVPCRQGDPKGSGGGTGTTNR